MGVDASDEREPDDARGSGVDECNQCRSDVIARRLDDSP